MKLLQFISASKNGRGWQTKAVFAFVLPLIDAIRVTKSFDDLLCPAEILMELRAISVRQSAILDALLDAETYGNTVGLAAQALLAAAQNVEDQICGEAVFASPGGDAQATGNKISADFR